MMTMPDFGTFSDCYKPDRQEVCAMDLRRTLSRNAPTLYVVQEAYGRDNVLGWVSGQLATIAMFTGVHQGDVVMTHQLLAMAKVIVSNFPAMRVTDMMLFIARFKAGYYGRFYGTFDPMVLTEAISQHFLPWIRQLRHEMISERQREEQRRQREHNDEVLIGYSEYLAMIGKKGE